MENLTFFHILWYLLDYWQKRYLACEALLLFVWPWLSIDIVPNNIFNNAFRQFENVKGSRLSR